MLRHAPLLLVVTACGLPDRQPLPDDSFAFGVFGDGPYFGWENGRFARLTGDVNAHDLAWLIHVGDILDWPCSDEAFAERLAAVNAFDMPVVYTPGDNEWTDCHQGTPGIYPPLDRLAAIRRSFFADPHSSLGARPMPVVSQAADPRFAEFPENVRWERGGFVFATLHLVGSGNASDPFPDRTAEDDREVRRRTNAALVWMEEAFAHAEGMHGVVLAFHGDPDFGTPGDRRGGYAEVIALLTRRAEQFDGEVLVIHGDSHELIVDHPLGSNVTRLETFGSPDIGWVRVVVDTVRGTFTTFEPRLMPRRWLLF